MAVLNGLNGKKVSLDCKTICNVEAPSLNNILIELVSSIVEPKNNFCNHTNLVHVIMHLFFLCRPNVLSYIYGCAYKSAQPFLGCKVLFDIFACTIS